MGHFARRRNPRLAERARSPDFCHVVPSVAPPRWEGEGKARGRRGKWPKVPAHPRGPVFAEPTSGKHPRRHRTHFLTNIGSVFPEERHPVQPPPPTYASSPGVSPMPNPWPNTHQGSSSDGAGLGRKAVPRNASPKDVQVSAGATKPQPQDGKPWRDYGHGSVDR